MLRAFMRGPMPFLCVGHMLDHMLTVIYASIVALTLTDLWAQSYGDLLKLSWFGMVLFGAGAPLAGWLADRWSATGMMVVYFIGMGASSILTGFASSPVEIAVGIGLIGLFASIYHPVGIPMILAVSGAARGKMLGINGVFGSLGLAVAAGFAGVMVAVADWRIAFIAPGIIAIAIGIWFWIRFRHGVPVVERKKSVESSSRGIGAFLWVFLLLCLMTAGAGMVFQTVTYNLTEIVDIRAGTWLENDALMIGVAVSAIMALGAIAQLGGGIIADRYPLRRAFLMIYTPMVAALVAASFAEGPLAIVILIGIIAITVGNQPVADTLFGEFFPERWISLAYGVRFALSLGVAAAAIPLAAAVVDSTGDVGILFLILAGFASMVIVSLLLLPRNKTEIASAALPAPAE